MPSRARALALTLALAAACATRPAPRTPAPVTIELLPVFLAGSGELARLAPEAAPTWLVEFAFTAHPSDAVAAALAERGLTARVVHSTSWRYDAPGRLVLTYLAVLDAPTAQPGFHVVPVTSTAIARGSATRPPEALAAAAVVAHALRHLAFLYATDPAVTQALGEAWRLALTPYDPEPFLQR